MNQFSSTQITCQRTCWSPTPLNICSRHWSWRSGLRISLGCICWSQVQNWALVFLAPALLRWAETAVAGRIASPLEVDLECSQISNFVVVVVIVQSQFSSLCFFFFLASWWSTLGCLDSGQKALGFWLESVKWWWIICWWLCMPFRAQWLPGGTYWPWLASEPKKNNSFCPPASPVSGLNDCAHVFNCALRPVVTVFQLSPWGEIDTLDVPRDIRSGLSQWRDPDPEL